MIDLKIECLFGSIYKLRTAWIRVELFSANLCSNILQYDAFISDVTVKKILLTQNKKKLKLNY